MKITTNSHIDYPALGYSKDSGWLPQYDWNDTKNVIKWGNRISMIVSMIAFSIFAIVFFDGYNLVPLILTLVVAMVIYIFLVIPIHELLHFLPKTWNVFSNKCWIYVSFGSLGAHYDGKISRRKFLIAKLFPFISITLILIALSFVSNALHPYLIVIGICNTIGSWVDIYMTFYLSKVLPKNCIIYGTRYKIIPLQRGHSADD